VIYVILMIYMIMIIGVDKSPKGVIFITADRDVMTRGTWLQIKTACKAGHATFN
jgi:hypothetical protein